MSANEIPTPTENGDAVAEIARIGEPDAAGLVVQIMDANARSAERIDAQILSYAEQDRDKWKARALDAEDKLARIQNRFLELIEF